MTEVVSFEKWSRPTILDVRYGYVDWRFRPSHYPRVSKHTYYVGGDLPYLTRYKHHLRRRGPPESFMEVECELHNILCDHANWVVCREYIVRGMRVQLYNSRRYGLHFDYRQVKAVLSARFHICAPPDRELCSMYAIGRTAVGSPECVSIGGKSYHYIKKYIHVSDVKKFCDKNGKRALDEIFADIEKMEWCDLCTHPTGEFRFVHIWNKEGLEWSVDQCGGGAHWRAVPHDPLNTSERGARSRPTACTQLE